MLRSGAFTAAMLACASGAFATSTPDPAEALRARYASLGEALAQSPIQQGLYLESVDSSRAPRGDAYAIVNYPFAKVSAAFDTPESWCEALILHLNVQYCRAEADAERTALSAALGKKTNQPLEDTHRITLLYSVVASRTDFMRVELTGKKGPLGTGNYLIAVEFIPLDAGRAFMHLQYSYTQGVLARLATGVYFSTSGRDKVGFTSVQAGEYDPPQLVRGIRGALERNTMRYYLALDAHLHALASPASQRFEQSIERWFKDTERFARQLREVKHEDYIAMKRGQYLRQQVIDR
jgi:hypothetical protein